jgi:hypothetical protein
MVKPLFLLLFTVVVLGLASCQSTSGPSGSASTVAPAGPSMRATRALQTSTSEPGGY